MYDVPGLAEPVQLSKIVTAASLLAAGPLLGWLIQRVIVGRLKRRATITTWGGDGILVAAIHDVVIIWLSLAGAFGAISVLPLNLRLEDGLKKLLLAALVLSGTVVVARAASDVIKLYSLRSERAMRSSSIFVNLARIVIAVVGFMVLLQTLGVSITPLVTALGVGGLAVALAMQDTLANFFAGLQIIATKKVKPGDFIRVRSGEEGYVVDIDWRHTSIRQLPNNMILVPNTELVNSILTNFYYPEREMSVLMEVGVSYESDLKHVEQVTIEVAGDLLKEVAGGVPEFEPFIRYHTFNDFSIDFTVILRVREFTDQYLLKHEFVKRLHDRYEQEGIVIPFPIRTVQLPEARAAFGDIKERTDGRRTRR